jgi:hypothetical protein
MDWIEKTESKRLRIYNDLNDWNVPATYGNCDKPLATVRNFPQLIILT